MARARSNTYAAAVAVLWPLRADLKAFCLIVGSLVRLGGGIVAMAGDVENCCAGVEHSACRCHMDRRVL